jgi:hypothetical protein
MFQSNQDRRHVARESCSSPRVVSAVLTFFEGAKYGNLTQRRQGAKIKKEAMP